jgi:PiT family inorganic phosphate transporter
VLKFLAPVYVGWSLGANDASNAFGTAVASKMLRFRTAALLGAGFVVLGSVLEGRAGLETIGGLADFEYHTAVIASVAAAVAVTVLTILRLPISTSQAVVGAIVGLGLVEGGVHLDGLAKIVVCWIGTPIGSMLAAMVLYVVLAPLFNRLSYRMIAFDFVLRACLVVVGCYAAYALGANNVANVTGAFVGAGILEPGPATLVGGASIALGILTFSRPVMMTIGRGIIRLNAYGAFIAVLAQAVTVHFYAQLGVPVSSSQAVVGAVLGVGLLKSVETIRRRAVFGILSGWVATPLLAAMCALPVHFLLVWFRVVGR